jgi:hypothetical protein
MGKSGSKLKKKRSQSKLALTILFYFIQFVSQYIYNTKILVRFLHYMFFAHDLWPSLGSTYTVPLNFRCYPPLRWSVFTIGGGRIVVYSAGLQLTT